jgi:hypothetical protein
MSNHDKESWVAHFLETSGRSQKISGDQAERPLAYKLFSHRAPNQTILHQELLFGASAELPHLNPSMAAGASP